MFNIPHSTRQVNSKTQVGYNQKARLWEARNGRVWQWPAGPMGKRQAQLYALEHDAPMIADEVKAIITNAQAVNPNSTEAEAITRRAIKAGFLIRDGFVLPPRPFDAKGSYLNEIARVRSSTQSWPDGSAVEYAVTQLDTGQVWCECKDFQDDAPLLPSGQKACGHILAILICDSLELDTEALQQTGIHSSALDNAILKAEIAYHDLTTLLQEMRLAQDNLSLEAVNLLQQTVHPFTAEDGQICIRFEVDFDGIYSDITEAAYTADIPY